MLILLLTLSARPQEIATYYTSDQGGDYQFLNNPTGVVYSESLRRNRYPGSQGEEYGSTIYVLSDEPYNKLVYDSVILHRFYKYLKILLRSILSVNLSLPGEVNFIM